MTTAKELIQLTKNVKLLYVEDDPALRKDTLRLLTTFFDKIDVATDGLEALDTFDCKTHDLVISDLVMPRMDGELLSQKIRERCPDQLIILLTAHNEREIVQKLRATGVTDFIFKPLDIRQFIETLYKTCLSLSGG